MVKPDVGEASNNKRPWLSPVVYAISMGAGVACGSLLYQVIMQLRYPNVTAYQVIDFYRAIFVGVFTGLATYALRRYQSRSSGK